MAGSPFCDIHLTDGSSLKSFSRCLFQFIIFVTAYNQYALQAFKANGLITF